MGVVLTNKSNRYSSSQIFLLKKNNVHYILKCWLQRIIFFYGLASTCIFKCYDARTWEIYIVHVTKALSFFT